MAKKSIAALAEEVQNAQEGTKETAQSVETAEPKKDTTEQETTPETQQDAQKEQPEAKAITIDELEELELPGDSDTGETVKEFRITDDGCAEWALRKIKVEKDEYDRIERLANEMIQKAQEALEKARRRYDQNTSFLTYKLSEFFDGVPHRVSKTGAKETYRLLSGQLVLKRGGAELKPDDSKLVEWLKQSGHNDMIKTEEKPTWGDFKKKLNVIGTTVVYEETGELVDGITVVDKPNTFKVEF